MSRSGRAARSWAARRGEPVPTVAPAGRSASFRPSRAQRTSRTSTRLGVAARVSPRAGPVGRSLSECTATSHTSRSRASRSAATNTPVPPIWDSEPVRTSPSVRMWTSSTGKPPTAASWSAVCWVWVRASLLARVPIRTVTASPVRLPGSHVRGRGCGGRVGIVSGPDAGVRARDGGLFAAEVGAAAWPADVEPGAERGQVRPVGDVVRRGPLADQVHDAGHELAVRSGRGDTGGHDAQLGAGLQGLGVEVPHNFHVVADKAQRHNHDALDALAGELLDGVVDVGFEPRHVRGAGPGLVDEGPRGGQAGLSASTRRMTSVAAARCWAT